MSTRYPASIDNSSNLPAAVDNVTGVNAASLNQLRGAILAIESELGVKPSSTFSTVRARLDALEAAINSGGGGGGEAIKVANIAALTAATGIQTGDQAYVGTIKSFFVYDSSSGLTSDNISIVNSGLGGRWLRSPIPDPSWVYVTDWFIDPSTGNDEAAGSSLAPLLSWAELNRRWGLGARIPQSVSVTLVNDLLDADPLEFDIKIINGSEISILGTPTVRRAGSVTSLISKNRATNTPIQITDSGMSGTWTTDLNKRVTLTSGPNTGVWAWVNKDLGSKKARTTDWVGDLFGVGSYSPPIVGNTYKVENLTKVRLGLCHADADLSTNGVGDVYFQDIEFSGSSGAYFYLNTISSYFIFYGCLINFTIEIYGDNGFSFYNCNLVGGGIQTHGLNFAAAGRLGGENGFTIAGGVFAIDFGTFVDGTGVLVQNGKVLIGEMACFDCTIPAHTTVSGSGLQIAEGSSARVDGYGIWGSGNAGYGISLKTNSSIEYNVNLGTVTGALGDLSINGKVTARSWNNNSGIFTNNRAATWTNFGTALSSGGLGGEIWDPETNIKITKLILDTADGYSILDYNTSNELLLGNSSTLGIKTTAYYIVWGPAAIPVDGYVVTLQTGNATPTSIFTIATLDDDKITRIDVEILGKKATTADSLSTNLSMAWIRSSGTSADIGTITESDNRNHGTGSTWSATISRSTNAVNIMVTGAAATTINWTAILQITKGQ